MEYNSKCGRYHTYIGHVVFDDEDSWFVDVVSKNRYIVDEDFYSNYDDALITFNEAKKEIQKDERKYAIKTKANRI
tara:strand:- start:112 stop:339 length:228 start_codon:yes stop_codon:yes gene_type:complete